ncbi:MAG: 4-hydroxy-tetrahydrodipicolinate synthase [Alloprevotella sp.]|nr:4-hydroxy-tetrahydrodipicolinate synthase [Alloprevotella sp.]
MNQPYINPFRGFGVALVTPFKENGEVDYDALRRLVEMQVENGVDFLCVLGTTAETPTLSRQERLAIRQTVVLATDHRIPLLLGAGGNNTQAICDELESDDLEGFQGVLIVCPFYNKPSQEGLFQHFMAISRASHLPIVIYNIPGRTGVNLDEKTLCRIVESAPNVVAIKEAAGKLEQIDRFVKATPPRFEVLCGDDALAYDALKDGATGVISVVGNAYPKLFGEMVHQTIKRNYIVAERINQQLQDFYKLMMLEGNPAGIKCLLKKLGLSENKLRLPLVPVSPLTSSLIDLAAHTLDSADK